MNVSEYLLDELKRLNRHNDLIEKKINQGKAISNEPELIVCNVLAMCEIAKIYTKVEWIKWKWGESMEEIEKSLIEIINEQLNQYKSKKEVPSKDVLDTIDTLIAIERYS